MITNESNILIQIGISIESIQILQEQQQQLTSTKEIQTKNNTPSILNSNDMIKFCQKMLENLFNYVISFSKPLSINNMNNNQSQIIESIPTEIFQKWYLNFQNKLQKDPNFWKI